MITNTYEHHDFFNNNHIPVSIRKTHWGENSSCSSNWHSNIELHYAFSGTAVLVCDTEHITITKGEIAIVNSNKIHRIFSKTEFHGCCVIINNSFTKNCGIDAEKLCFKPKIASKNTARIIEKLFETKQDADFLAAAKRQSLTLELIIDLCTGHIYDKSSITIRSDPAEKYVKKAIRYINTNFTQPISLTEIAEQIGITKNYLAAEFKKHTGQTVITYLNHIRCRNAASLIANGMNITEAALESGFETLSYFSRIYKKLFGVPPSKIR